MMTYQEIKDRLSKCELALSKIKDGTYNSTTIQDLEATREKLEVLKESYLKLLKEEDDMEPGFVATDDEDKAADLAKDGVKVKLTSEQEGVEFSAQEMKAIAKKTGEALIKALRNAGDEIDTIKAHSFDINTVDIYVKYKNDFEDEFTFDVRDDRLHLVDFSFDKELVDVGVKPSGEAIVNVDVLANELTKHFKSLNEEDINENIPTVFDDESMDALLNIILKYVEDPADAERELEKFEDGGYDALSPELLANLDRDPEFKAWYNNLHSIKEEENDRQKYLRMLDMYKRASRNDRDDIRPKLEKAAKQLGIKLQLSEAPEGLFYLKVDIRDARKAIDILDDKYRKQVEFSGSDTYYFGDEQTAYDAMLDFSANDVVISDTNLDLFAEEKLSETETPEGGHDQGGDLDVGHQDDEPNMLKKDLYDIAVYASKLYKQLDKYDKMDGEVDFPHWWQKKVTLARQYMSSAQHYLEAEEKQPMIDALALQEEVNEANINPEAEKYVKRFIAGVAKKYGYDEMDAVHLIYQVLANTGYLDMRLESINERVGALQDFINLIRDRAVDSEFSEQEEALEVIEALADHYGIKIQTGGFVGEIGMFHDPRGYRKSKPEPEVFDKKYVAKDTYDILKHGKKLMTFFGSEGEANAYINKRNREVRGEGKYKSDAQRKAIYATKAEKGELKEEMDGGQLFDYFAKKGYEVTERRPDGKEAGFDGYMVSRGSSRSPQAVIFQYDKDVDQFMISRISGYRIDQDKAMKAGMRQAGRSGVAGIDSYMTDGNYQPVDNAVQGLKDRVDHVMSGLDREAKAQSDFYANRGRTSGTIDEAATCCGRCGRTHVKGSGCKKPYLKGGDHCRNK